MLSIKEELRSIRDQIEASKSGLYLIRMTPIDNRAKSFPSDKRKHRIAVCKARCRISNVLMRYKNKEQAI